MRRAPFLMFLILAVAYFGNGIADSAFPDYIPVRPYSGPFVHAASALSFLTRSAGSIGTDLLGAAIIILFFSALLVQIANRTTGIVISHSGFTPNPNLTSSPGAATVLQIIPFIFTGILAFGLYEIYEKAQPREGL